MDKIEVRACADPCCGKPLVRRDMEKTHNWNKRRYCDKKCSGRRSNDISPASKPTINWYGLKTIDAVSQPELCHSLAIDTKGTPMALPMSRTEAEIDRLHEYNRMMNRRT